MRESLAMVVFIFSISPEYLGKMSQFDVQLGYCSCFNFKCPNKNQGTVGRTPNSVAMVFIVFSSDSSGVFPLFIGVHPTIPSINKPAHQTLESDQDGTTPTAQRIAALCEFHGICIFRRCFFWLVLSNIVMFTPTSGNDPI